MARPIDLIAAIHTKGLVAFLKRINQEILEDNLFTWAAAMAYSWLFAIFPFLIFLLTLLPFFPHEQKEFARQQIRIAVYQLPTDAGEKMLWPWLNTELTRLLNTPPKGALSLSLLVTLWAASGGMAMTMAALDQAYDVTRYRRYARQRGLAIGLTIVVVVLITAVLLLIPIGTFITNHFLLHYADQLHLSRALLIAWQVARFALAFVLMFTALSLIYYYGTNKAHKYHFITPGAIFCVAVWILLGILFRTYVDKFGHYSKTYGTVGGVVVLMFFFYLDALVLLVGAEINAEVDETVKKLTGKVEPPEEKLQKAMEKS